MNEKYSHPRLSASTAFKSHLKLKEKLSKFALFEDYFATLLDQLLHVLDLYTFPESEDDQSKAVLPDRDEIKQILFDALGTPDNWVALDVIGRITLCFRVVHEIAELFDLTAASHDLREKLVLPNFEKNSSAIIALTSLCSLLGLKAQATRVVVNRYRDVKFSITVEKTNPPFLGNSSPPHSILNAPTPGQENTAKNPSADKEESSTTDVSELNTDHSRYPTVREDERQEGLSIKKSTAVTPYFNNRGFSGALSESIDITLRDSEQCSMQYRLTGRRRVEFFVNILSGGARTFFLSNDRLGMSFYDIKHFMLEEYNFNAGQIQVRRILKSLRIDTFMQEHQIRSFATALTRMVDYINRLSPQFHPRIPGQRSQNFQLALRGTR